MAQKDQAEMQLLNVRSIIIIYKSITNQERAYFLLHTTSYSFLCFLLVGLRLGLLGLLTYRKQDFLLKGVLLLLDWIRDADTECGIECIVTDLKGECAAAAPAPARARCGDGDCGDWALAYFTRGDDKLAQYVEGMYTWLAAEENN
jgi:hypothetical protein